MKVLLIGYSSIARRRVLPAMQGLGLDIDIASRSAARSRDLPVQADAVFDDYGEALARSNADIVYISTPNHLHAPLAEQALGQGRHTIVDKPSFLSVDDARRLVELAGRRGLCLAEANVWGFHPQIDLARQMFAEAGSAPERLSAVFSFPPLPEGNVRYRAALGGGALWDLGPYTVSAGRLFFGAPPEDVQCRVLSHQGDVDTSYSVLMTYAGGRSLVGHCGFTTGYLNHLDVLGPDVVVRLDRVFTTPPDMAPRLEVNQHNETRTVDAPEADTFTCFLQQYLASLRDGKHDVWHRTLEEDAAALHRLRAAAGV